MGSTNTWLQILRIPMVVAVLMAAGQLIEPMARGVTRLQIDQVWRAWVPLALLAAAAAVLILAGRDRRHHPATLAIEAVIAGALGFVPAVQWVVWFGLSGVIGSTFASGGPAGLIQPLAIVWFIGAVATAIRQRRGDSNLRTEHPKADVASSAPRASHG